MYPRNVSPLYVGKYIVDKVLDVEFRVKMMREGEESLKKGMETVQYVVVTIHVCMEVWNSTRQWINLRNWNSRESVESDST